MYTFTIGMLVLIIIGLVHIIFKIRRMARDGIIENGGHPEYYLYDIYQRCYGKKTLRELEDG